MDSILYWNAVALEANRRDFSNVPGTDRPSPEQGGPTLSSRALAIVHLAMYDAFAGARNTPATLPPYLPGLPAAGAGAREKEAVAYAAHTTLSALYPRQRPFFDERLASSDGFQPLSSPGKEFGLLVGAAMLDDRRFDPDAGAASYVPSSAPGHHRDDPANPGKGFHGPVYGAASKGFAISARHWLKAPPRPSDPLTAGEYKRAFEQVFGKGIAPELAGTLPAGIDYRSSEETLIGLYWAYDGVRELGTPPRLYNLIVREVAMAQGNTFEQNARLFALVNAALGDAGILAWDQKYIHDFWRPVVGVREHDPSMGPAGVPGKSFDALSDPCWLPLGAPASNSHDPNFTPPFPAYPSGHATFGAAALHMVRLFYGVSVGDRGPDTTYQGPFVSGELDGKTTDNRGFVRPRHNRLFSDGLWQMIEENGFSRVFLGVHWFFDAFALDKEGKPDLNQNIGGVPLGLTIAEDIWTSGGMLAPKKSTVGPRC
jgi:Vanadium chloroperoxidase N-terminal domain/PAP2 superfamily